MSNLVKLKPEAIDEDSINHLAARGDADSIVDVGFDATSKLDEVQLTNSYGSDFQFHGVELGSTSDRWSSPSNENSWTYMAAWQTASGTFVGEIQENHVNEDSFSMVQVFDNLDDLHSFFAVTNEALADEVIEFAETKLQEREALSA